MVARAGTLRSIALVLDFQKPPHAGAGNLLYNPWHNMRESDAQGNSNPRALCAKNLMLVSGKSMRALWPMIVLCSFSALAVGCKATPQKVCGHLKTLGAENADQCVPYFEEIQARTPQYWDNISQCILAAQDASMLHTCNAVVDLVRAQALCAEVMDRLPEAYDASLTHCLDTQYEHQARGDLDWNAYEQCVQNAQDLDALDGCVTQ